MQRKMKALLFLVLIQGLCLQAQSLKIYQFDHTSWIDRDGVPPQITAIAQNEDGTLWLGTETGLYHFDGLRFTPFDTTVAQGSSLAGPINGLAVTEDNVLWVTLGGKGVVSVQGSKVTSFDERSGLPRGRVTQVLQGPKHTILALADDRMWQLSGVRWSDISGAIGLPKGTLSRALLDHAGRLWVAAAGHLWVLPSEGGKLIASPTPAGFRAALAQSRDGTVWVQTNEVRALRVAPAVSPISPAPQWIALDLGLRPEGDLSRSLYDFRPVDLGGFQLLIDRGGSLWSGTDHGLWKLNPAPKADSRNASADTAGPWNGLSGDAISALLEDSSGNLWVATQNGLDRLARSVLTPLLPRTEGEHYSVVALPGGHIWFAPADSLQTLSTIRDGIVIPVGPKRLIFTLFCDRNGVLWFADEHAFWSMNSGRFTRFPAPSGIAPWEIRQIAGSNGADLVVLTRKGELWHFDNGRWTRLIVEHLAGTPSVLISTARGEIWIGTSQGSIRQRQADGQWKEYLSSSSELGAITGFLDLPEGLLTATSRGLFLVADHKFRFLQSGDATSLYSITGMQRLQNGDLWLNGPHGVLRIPAKELQQAFHSADHIMQAEIISAKGILGPVITKPGAPTMAQDARGVLWISTFHGMVSVDPANLHQDNTPPSLLPPQVNVDDKRVGKERSFPPDLHTLRIQYMGVQLSDPQRVIYRYKLDGVDPSWQEVGTSREAVYTGLRPGHYRFELMASNGAGSWSTSANYLVFDVRPTFYQTTWFRILAGSWACLLGWIVLRVRDRYVSRQMKIRAEERAEERVRIARDLHDTLLQGVQGLMLRFHVASLSVAEGSPSRRMLDRALTSADAVIAEGRNRISRLRSDSLAGISLEEALQTLCDQMDPDGGIQMSLTTTGRESAIRPLVKEELYCIAREALVNAFSHAQATHIEVQISYDAKELQISCIDDGIGFISDPSKTSAKANHWGMVGMRERASKIGAMLVIESTPGQGTCVTLSIKGGRAYSDLRLLGRLTSSS